MLRKMMSSYNKGVQLVRNGDKIDYSIKDDGGLYYKSILCMSNV